MSKLHQNSIDFIYSELPHRLKNFNTYLFLTLFSIPFYWHKDWMEMPGSLLLLLVVAPSFVAYTIRDGVTGVFICLAIGCYLLQEHIRASGPLSHVVGGDLPLKESYFRSFAPSILKDI